MQKALIANPEAEVAERSERAKKLYRYVSDVARRIDDAATNSRTISDLFNISKEVQRQKLRDHCEKLMFLDPVNYGKKSLELLWRKVYYETVSTAKKLRESDSENENYLFTHIVCGIGHFHNLISRIQFETKITFKELDYSSLYEDEEIGIKSEVTIDIDFQQFGRSALHSCLIYLGDLSRYQSEFFHTFDSSIAARYYLQAAQIDMNSGMPYNQLGNLYCDKNHNLDSVCYYIHCLSCTEPFEGALGNLTKLFEKNAQYSDMLTNNETLTQAEHIQGTIAQFLSLIELWYLGKNDTDIPQRCNLIAHQMKICIELTKLPLPDVQKSYDEYLQALEDESINPTCLSANIIHKIVLICLFSIAKLNETDEKKAFACKAFTLALFSQLLQKLLEQVLKLGLHNPADKYRRSHPLVEDVKPEEQIEEQEERLVETVEEPVKEENPVEQTNGDTHENATDNEPNQNQNGDGKVNSKKISAKRRRRRRLASSESSEASDLESSDALSEESCSDEEELSDSSYESDDDEKSDRTAQEETDTEDVNIPAEKQNGEPGNVQEDKNNFQPLNGKAKEKEIKPRTKETKNSLNEIEIKNFLYGDNILPSIKLLQDWILTEKDLILSCGESGESLFQCVVDLLNIFTANFKPAKKSNNPPACPILEYAKTVAKNVELEYKMLPLPEDVNLRGTDICKYDKDAAEWQVLNSYRPSAPEENVIRILNFIDFGTQVAKLVPRIRLNRLMHIYYLKKTEKKTSPKVSTKLNHKKSREWHNSKKNGEGESGLLNRLGRLWLASRVKELERYGQAATAPTLLALDAAALNKHLRKVKLLMKARVFVLLVPTVVLQELDNLKREESTARDAIRWLEAQLASGSRFVRAQRAGQSRPLPLLKYPRKAPPHVHNFIQILEFCHHFVADDKPQGGNGDPDSSLNGKSAPLLVLLTGTEPGSVEERYKEFSVTGAARAAGVCVEYIGNFYAKWRQTLHKSGKKR